jgi:hypothetical protein
MLIHTTKVDLTDQELLFLDGKCGEKIQAEINTAKSRLKMLASGQAIDSSTALFISDCLKEVETKKKLICRCESLSHCKYCSKSGGYALRKRATKYHEKGSKDYDKPLYFAGVELAESFIYMKGHATLGCCGECWKKFKAPLVAAIENVPAEISEKITGCLPKFKRWSIMQCTHCKWSGPEYEMIEGPNLMGHMIYNECPNCNQKNSIFHLAVKSTLKYVVVPVPSTETNNDPRKDYYRASYDSNVCKQME